MPDIAHTASEMIAGMTPVMRPGVFVFATTNDPNLVASLYSEAISTFQEDEGVSMLIPVKQQRNQSFLWIRQCGA